MRPSLWIWAFSMKIVSLLLLGQGECCNGYGEGTLNSLRSIFDVSQFRSSFMKFRQGRIDFHRPLGTLEPWLSVEGVGEH